MNITFGQTVSQSSPTGAVLLTPTYFITTLPYDGKHLHFIFIFITRILTHFYIDVSSNGVQIHVFNLNTSLFTVITELGTKAADKFGLSAALVGDTLFVGAPGTGSGGNAVYIYDLLNGNAKIQTINSPVSAVRFGLAVAAFGSYLVIGAPDNGSGTSS